MIDRIWVAVEVRLNIVSRVIPATNLKSISDETGIPYPKLKRKKSGTYRLDADEDRVYWDVLRCPLRKAKRGKAFFGKNLKKGAGE